MMAPATTSRFVKKMLVTAPKVNSLSVARVPAAMANIWIGRIVSYLTNNSLRVASLYESVKANTASLDVPARGIAVTGCLFCIRIRILLNTGSPVFHPIKMTAYSNEGRCLLQMFKK